jgi:hypothetical protein
MDVNALHHTSNQANQHHNAIQKLFLRYLCYH